MRKAHAIHNEDACNFLLNSGKFNDWVVTTAFYSSLHYIHHEIFPLEHKNTTFTNFNGYYDVMYGTSINNRPSKHNVTIELVKNKLPNCSRFYRWLHDECSNARYKNYKVSENIANQSKRYLDNIKLQLTK